MFLWFGAVFPGFGAVCSGFGVVFQEFEAVCPGFGAVFPVFEAVFQEFGVSLVWSCVRRIWSHCAGHNFVLTVKIIKFK